MCPSFFLNQSHTVNENEIGQGNEIGHLLLLQNVPEMAKYQKHFLSLMFKSG